MRRWERDRKLLIRIMKRYSSGTASPDEEDFVKRYFLILEKRHGSEFVLSDLQLNELEAEIRNDLMKSIRMNRKSSLHQIHSLTWRRIAVAASVLVVFGIAAFLWSREAVPSPDLSGRRKLLPSNQIQPGTNKAILTLADGSSIVLDSSGNGMLTRQGNTRVFKLANGEIVYEALNAGESKIIYNTMSTPIGGTYRLVLPDGSKVWLNAASSITYPTSFTGKQRQVKTTGEIYFEIARDAARPFIVSLPDESAIQVVGTHFNVNAYGDNGIIQTTLIEGKVRVATSRTRVSLRPGQQAITAFHSDPAEIAVLDNIDIEQVTAWKNGYFHFNRVDITTVMKEIARWYDIEVVYEGSPPKDKFIGELPKNIQFTEVLRALEKIGVHFRVEAKKVIVTR